MRWDAPAGASQYCLDMCNADVGAQFIAPWWGADPCHEGAMNWDCGAAPTRRACLGDAALFSGDEASCSLP